MKGLRCKLEHPGSALTGRGTLPSSGHLRATLQVPGDYGTLLSLGFPADKETKAQRLGGDVLV